MTSGNAAARLAVSIFLALAAPAVAQEMPLDVRGEWVADVNPTTRDMFVTDCPCEDSGEAIEMTCAAQSGTVRIEFKDFLTDKAKVGDKADVTLTIDGQGRTLTGDMAAYTDGFVMPAVSFPTNEALFAALSAGNRLTLSSAGRSAETRLKGSNKAMAAMIAYCRK